MPVLDRRIFLAWLAVGAYAALIYYLSSRPHPIPYIGFLEKYHIDFVLHGIEYGVFGFLMGRALWLAVPGRPAPALFWIALLAGVFYGLSDEWHQSFVPNRDSNAVDLLADTIGTAAGLSLWFYLTDRKESK